MRIKEPPADCSHNIPSTPLLHVRHGRRSKPSNRFFPKDFGDQIIKTIFSDGFWISKLQNDFFPKVSELKPSKRFFFFFKGSHFIRFLSSASRSYSNRELIDKTFWLLMTIHRIIKLLRTLRKCIWVSWNPFFANNLNHPSGKPIQT